MKKWTAGKIQGLRHAMGLTQQQFAEKFRVNLATVKKWEQGLSPPIGPATVLLDQLEEQLIPASAE